VDCIHAAEFTDNMQALAKRVLSLRAAYNAGNLTS
jgi:hypothetical protein